MSEIHPPDTPYPRSVEDPILEDRRSSILNWLLCMMLLFIVCVGFYFLIKSNIY